MDVGIIDTCILRGDSYHLLNEICPKECNFGHIYFPSIMQRLVSMITSNYKSEWRCEYHAARKLVSSAPLTVDKLDTIYQKPNYYAGYNLRNSTCNLSLK